MRIGCRHAAAYKTDVQFSPYVYVVRYSHRTQSTTGKCTWVWAGSTTEDETCEEEKFLEYLLSEPAHDGLWWRSLWTGQQSVYLAGEKQDALLAGQPEITEQPRMNRIPQPKAASDRRDTELMLAIMNIQSQHRIAMRAKAMGR